MSSPCHAHSLRGLSLLHLHQAAAAAAAAAVHDGLSTINELALCTEGTGQIWCRQ